MKICLKTRDKIVTFDFEDVMWDAKSREIKFFNFYNDKVVAEEVASDVGAYKIVDAIGKCLITDCQYLQIVILANGEVLV